MLHSQARRNRRRGTVMILFVVSLVALLGIVAISFEGGFLLQERRKAQAATDAAAMAGAVDFYEKWYNEGVDVGGTAEQTAYTTMAAHGYSNDGDTEVIVNVPPESGDHIGEPSYIEVIVTQKVERSFSAVFGGGPNPVRARAVARGGYFAVKEAIIVLNLREKAALTSSGNGSVSVIGGPMHVNSDHVEAAVAGGGGTVHAEPLDVVGGTVNNGSGGGFTGTINTGERPIPDPLRHIPEPDPTQLTPQRSTPLHLSGNRTVTLSPGVYIGGITITGQASVIMEPGIYYMNGGGFSFSGQGSLTGEGVMIYNDPDGNAQSHGISITGSGGGTVDLSPPTSGTYKGISLFQERVADVNMNIEGNGSFSITGLFYAAGALLKVKGNGDSTVGNQDTLGSQYVSDRLDTGGNGNYSVVYNIDLAPSTRVLQIVE